MKKILVIFQKEMLDNLRDVPGVRVRPEIGLGGGQAADFVREPHRGHFQVGDEMLPLDRAQRGRRRPHGTQARDERDHRDVSEH